MSTCQVGKILSWKTDFKSNSIITAGKSLDADGQMYADGFLSGPSAYRVVCWRPKRNRRHTLGRRQTRCMPTVFPGCRRHTSGRRQRWYMPTVFLGRPSAKIWPSANTAVVVYQTHGVIHMPTATSLRPSAYNFFFFFCSFYFLSP